MTNSTNYENDTLNAYRSVKRAEQYKRYHTKDWSWARISTWREQLLIARELSRYSWTTEDALLDIPCGTGILGGILRSFPFKIIASDISPEMMELAKDEYPKDRFLGFTRGDITKTGFSSNSFSCVVCIGFMHRVPLEIKRKALRELYSITKNVAIITFSVDSPLQRLKKKALTFIRRSLVPAPSPLPLNDIIVECEHEGFKVIRSFMVIPFLSAEAMVVLEKK